MKIKGRFFSKIIIDIFPHPKIYAVMLIFKITANLCKNYSNMKDEALPLIHNEERTSPGPMKRAEDQLLTKLEEVKTTNSVTEFDKQLMMLGDFNAGGRSSSEEQQSKQQPPQQPQQQLKQQPPQQPQQEQAKQQPQEQPKQQQPKQQPPQPPSQEQQRPTSDLDNKAIGEKLAELSLLIESCEKAGFLEPSKDPGQGCPSGKTGQPKQQDAGAQPAVAPPPPPSHVAATAGGESPLIADDIRLLPRLTEYQVDANDKY
jgi:outer membrane biosynthesis protein TonB